VLKCSNNQVIHVVLKPPSCLILNLGEKRRGGYLGAAKAAQRTEELKMPRMFVVI
jgi:hypothetical protein